MVNQKPQNFVQIPGVGFVQINKKQSSKRCNLCGGREHGKDGCPIYCEICISKGIPKYKCQMPTKTHYACKAGPGNKPCGRCKPHRTHKCGSCGNTDSKHRTKDCPKVKKVIQVVPGGIQVIQGGIQVVPGRIQVVQGGIQAIPQGINVLQNNRLKGSPNTPIGNYIKWKQPRRKRVVKKSNNWPMV